MEEELTMTKEEKLLKKAIDKHSIKEIKEVLSRSNTPISKEIVVPILRGLIGRSNFDFSVVDLLQKRNCDLNPTLASEYRLGDYLAYFGRLSPRLITEMGKAGYSFSRKNEKGEHAGFYLIASRPLNKKVIASLKAQGLDFNEKNNEGKTAVDTMVAIIEKYTSTQTDYNASALAFNRFSGLLDTPEELTEISRIKGDNLKKIIKNAIDKIEPKSYENIGIVELYEDSNHTALQKQMIIRNKIPSSKGSERIREGE